jgi:hypothetical protein
VSENDVSKIGETSLMFKVNSVTDDIKSLSTQSRVTNLIGNVPTSVEIAMAKTSPNVPEGEPFKMPVVAQPAIQTQPAQDTMAMVFAALRAAGIQIPAAMPNNVNVQPQQNQFAPAQNRHVPPQDNCIMTFDDLVSEVVNLPGVNNNVNIPTDRKMTPMEAESILTKMPKLRKHAFLRNNIQSQLMISDLFTTIDGGGSCLALLPGAVYDLARIPARNLLNCRELKWCFDTGKVQLVSESDYIASFKKIEKELDNWDRMGTLQIYDSRESVGEVGMGPSNNSDIVVNTDENIAPYSVYEDNPMMTGLIGRLPTERENVSPQTRIMR